MKNYILFHRNCLDGFLSGVLAYNKAVYVGIENIVMIPANYGDTPIRAEAGDTITIVDFSYPPETVNNYLDVGVSVVVADHHKSAIDDTINHAPSFKNLGFQTLMGEVKDIEGIKDHLYHSPYISASNCSCDNFSIFSNILNTSINKETKPKGKFMNYMSYNEHKDKENINKLSGAGLVYRLITRTSSFSDVDLIANINTNLGPDIKKTVELAQTHDLWLHEGDYTSQGMQLSYWFKKFNAENKLVINEIISKPDESASLFNDLIAKFKSTSLEEKLAIGKKNLETDVVTIRDILTNMKSVKLHDGLHPDKAIGFVKDKRLEAGLVSLAGSIASRELNMDVVILDMDKDKDPDITIYSMRSNAQGKDVDVASIAKHFVDSKKAKNGGGHKNAAGVAFPRDSVFFDEV